MVTRACPVAKAEVSRYPLFGKIGRLISAVWVAREDQAARDQTVARIRRRCNETGWPRLLIFPEERHTLIFQRGHL